MTCTCPVQPTDRCSHACQHVGFVREFTANAKETP